MFSSPLLLVMPDNLQMTDQQFFEFCQVNRDYRIERSKNREILIMPPVGGIAGNRGANILGQIGIWSEKEGTGIGFDCSTGFQLSTGAVRSPDASWIKLERWNSLTQQQQDQFVPLCPDFIIELRSSSDRLKPLKEKMQEYMQEPGARLGWLIERQERKVYIYRPGMEEECLDNPDTISGESVLSGFVLNMSKVW